MVNSNGLLNWQDVQYVSCAEEFLPRPALPAMSPNTNSNKIKANQNVKYILKDRFVRGRLLARWRLAAVPGSPRLAIFTNCPVKPRVRGINLGRGGQWVALLHTSHSFL